MRRFGTLALAAAFTALACNEGGPVDPLPFQGTADQARVAEGKPQGFGPAATGSYKVTLSNLTEGQPFTPPLAAVHRAARDLFEVGTPASFELQQIAENGKLGFMLTALEDDKHVEDLSVNPGPTLAPVLPGESVTFHVHGERGANRLSVVSMLICTNDGFTGLDAVKLPEQLGEVVTLYSDAYDAGTEQNTEDFADLVPPCPALTGVATDAEGTGDSDPALAEDGVVHHHPGIMGIAMDGLDPAIHGWMNPVARIEIERVK